MLRQRAQYRVQAAVIPISAAACADAKRNKDLRPPELKSEYRISILEA
jgi:hypothetical protein